MSRAFWLYFVTVHLPLSLLIWYYLLRLVLQ